MLTRFWGFLTPSSPLFTSLLHEFMVYRKHLANPNFQGGLRVFYFFTNFSKSYWKISLRFQKSPFCRWFLIFFVKSLWKSCWDFKSPLLSPIFKKFLSEFSWIPTANYPLIGNIRNLIIYLSFRSIEICIQAIFVKKHG